MVKNANNDNGKQSKNKKSVGQENDKRRNQERGATLRTQDEETRGGTQE